MEGNCAPSEGVASPPSKLKDWSTTEDDPCEPETQEVEYPETKDICSVFSDTIRVTSCANDPMVLSSQLKPCFE